jgi:hypothetical protein
MNPLRCTNHLLSSKVTSVVVCRLSTILLPSICINNRCYRRLLTTLKIIQLFITIDHHGSRTFNQLCPIPQSHPALLLVFFSLRNINRSLIAMNIVQLRYYQPANILTILRTIVDQTHCIRTRLGCHIVDPFW